MLSVSIVIVLLLAVTGVAVRARFSWRSLIALLAVLELVGLGLLGLPGAAFLETLEPVVRRLGLRPISGDAAWPAAIMMSVVWPMALAPAYLVARSVQLKGWQRGLVALAVLVPLCASFGVLVSVVVD